MAKDAFGLDITTNSDDAVSAWNGAISDFLEARLSLGAQLKAALEADPEFVMALCFRGYFLMQLSTVETLGKVGELVVQAKVLAEGATRREQLHVAALEQWHQGRLSQACLLWEEILVDAPLDLLALRLHHFASFWQGARLALRDAPASTLGQMDEQTPGYGFVLGMLAFGLEENGDYVSAERYSREAVERNENDLWALHALAHVLEMQCRHGEGAELLERPFRTWADRNPFKDHVWWHAALFALEMGRMEKVLEIYDREVRIEEGGFYLDVQNAASLLQRLELAGVDIGERWDELADLAETRIDDHVIPFTDAHFMLALLGGGRIDAARNFIKSLKSFSKSGAGEAADVTGTVTVPLAEGLLAHAQGKYAQASDALYALRHKLAPLGGSHAQQDVFQQIMIDAVTKAGKTGAARSLLSERLVLRPGNDWAKQRLAALN